MEDHIILSDYWYLIKTVFNYDSRQTDRLDRIKATLERVSQQLDNQVVVNAELRQSVSALVETANIHQQGIELLAREIREQGNEMRDLRTDVTQLQEFQRTTSAALDRISAVLDYLVRQSGNGAGNKPTE